MSLKQHSRAQIREDHGLLLLMAWLAISPTPFQLRHSSQAKRVCFHQHDALPYGHAHTLSIVIPPHVHVPVLCC